MSKYTKALLASLDHEIEASKNRAALWKRCAKRFRDNYCYPQECVHKNLDYVEHLETALAEARQRAVELAEACTETTCDMPSDCCDICRLAARVLADWGER